MDANRGEHRDCETILAGVTAHHQPNCWHDPCRHPGKGEGRRGLKAFIKQPKKHLQKSLLKHEGWCMTKKGLMKYIKGCWHQESPRSKRDEFDTKWEINREE